MGIFIVTILSFIAGLLLSITNKVLNSEDEILKEITEKLPGYNCNNCGEGDCFGYAKALYKDINLNNCRFLKKDKKQEIRDYIISQKEDL